MDALFPDSEGGWICTKHKKERGSQKYGSNCYLCAAAANEKHIAAKRELGKSLQNAWKTIEQLRKAIKNVPTSEYGRAQDFGADSCGAWDCFLEKLEEWKKRALKAKS